MRLALILALVACGKEAPAPEPTKPEPVTPAAKPAPVKPAAAQPAPPKPATPAAPATNPQPGVAAMLDGKPTTLVTALANTYDDGQVQVHLYNYAASCAEVTGLSTRASQPTDLELTLRVGRFLHPDGTRGWATRGAYWHPRHPTGPSTMQTEIQDGGTPFPKTTDLDAAAGATFELPLDLEMKTSAEQDPSSFSLKGTAKVTGCGPRQRQSDRPLLPPQAATIKLGGFAIPIARAALLVREDGSRTLEVSDREVVCVDGRHTSSKWPDVRVILEWNKAGKLETVQIGGALVPFASGDAGSIAATPNRATGSELTTTLRGATTVGGYPVALAGTVKAMVCPKG